MVALLKSDNRIASTLICGDALAELKKLPENSIDSIVTDPPYGLGEVKDIAGLLQAWMADEDDSQYLGKSGFMNKEWDAGVPGPRYWKEAYRVLKPGGHVLAFAGTRTYDLLVIALRLANFQIRDEIVWLYGSGFPKSQDISKAIDKHLGKEQEREVIGEYQYASRKGGKVVNSYMADWGDRTQYKETSPATPEAEAWNGWGSALKPSHEPICLARKPLAEKTIAENVLAYGTGGLNIDASRIALHGIENHKTAGSGTLGGHGIYGTANEVLNSKQVARAEAGLNPRYEPLGRFPANTLISHTIECRQVGVKRVKGTAPRGKPSHGQTMSKPEGWGYKVNGSGIDYNDEEGLETVEAWECSPYCAVRLLDEQSGITSSHGGGHRYKGAWSHPFTTGTAIPKGDTGTASRYFATFQPTPDDYAPFLYTSKASRRERSLGCEALPASAVPMYGAGIGEGKHPEAPVIEKNTHPTVKPIFLMKYLVTMITPPGGTVLDMFCGSGSTGVACVISGFNFIGIDENPEYVAIAEARIQHASAMNGTA